MNKLCTAAGSKWVSVQCSSSQGHWEVGMQYAQPQVLSFESYLPQVKSVKVINAHSSITSYCSFKESGLRMITLRLYARKFKGALLC